MGQTPTQTPTDSNAPDDPLAAATRWLWRTRAGRVVVTAVGVVAIAGIVVAVVEPFWPDPVPVPVPIPTPIDDGDPEPDHSSLVKAQKVLELMVGNTLLGKYTHTPK